jgi:exonuclease SbcD
MKLLHTADWHVGKQLRGRSRIDEHRRVLGEIVEIAEREAVDLVLVAGDLFETAAPAPEAERVVFDTLLALRATGAEVVVIAGNHDNPFAFDAFAPLCAAAGIVMVGHPLAPDAGGVLELQSRDGTPVRVGLLPFVSQRYAVRARELFALTAGEAVNNYASTVRALLDQLAQGFSPDAVNLLAVHCTVANARLGGGERESQTIFDYYVPPSVFPVAAHYVALGHLHRAQSVDAGPPTWYSGSPIQVDFGESDEDKHVLLVEATPGARAVVQPVPLTTPERLLTVRGTLAELTDQAATFGDAWLRVFVRAAPRAGLADEVRVALPRALDVRLDAPADRDTDDKPGRSTRTGRSPHDLFGEFLRERGVDDERLVALFDTLLDEVPA